MYSYMCHCTIYPTQVSTQWKSVTKQLQKMPAVEHLLIQLSLANISAELEAMATMFSVLEVRALRADEAATNCASCKVCSASIALLLMYSVIRYNVSHIYTTLMYVFQFSLRIAHMHRYRLLVYCVFMSVDTAGESEALKFLSGVYQGQAFSIQWRPISRDLITRATA